FVTSYVVSRLAIILISFSASPDLRILYSFPTRRSSDLVPCAHGGGARLVRFRGRRPLDSRQAGAAPSARVRRNFARARGARAGLDRKSTRLNSSHDQISYAVFCLKKKKRHEKI